MKKEKIEDTLLSMGISAGTKGFTYITEAIMLLDTEEWRYPKWTALYNEIGKKYGTTWILAERAIRRAFEVARGAKGKYETVEHYIGFTYTSNSASLSQLYLMLKREEENEESNA